MQRYFGKEIIDNKIILEQSDYHHIKNVMRMVPGDNIECVINDKLYLCSVTSNYDIEIVNEQYQKDDKFPEIILVIPLLKEQKMDLILQKATELGVTGFMIMPFNRSIVKFDERKEKVKLERWNRIIKEASEQSMRINIPFVSIENDFSIFENINDLKLICSTNERENYIRQALKNSGDYDRIYVVVGPEGGLEPKEEELLELKGFKKITLGTQIMRVETVPIFLTSVIRYEFTE